MLAFSIIIPLYNKQDFVKNTIDSILNQSYSNFEILIIDDCSTDESLTIVKQFTDPRIKIIQHSINKGLSASRNTGIMRAKNDYITFLDADDKWEASFLEIITSLATKYPTAACYGTNYQEVHNENHILEPQKNLPLSFKEGIIEDFFITNLHQPIYNYSCFCVKKEVFEKTGYFDESITFAEDIDFNIRIHLNYTLAYSTRIGSSYTMYSQNQITNSSISKKAVPNFTKYERLYPKNNSLKKYLDFQRYVLAKHYKIEKKLDLFKKLRREINPYNLTYKQRLLLSFPTWLTRNIRQFKTYLSSKGIRINSYR